MKITGTILMAFAISANAAQLVAAAEVNPNQPDRTMHLPHPGRSLRRRSGGRRSVSAGGAAGGVRLSGRDNERRGRSGSGATAGVSKDQGRLGRTTYSAGAGAGGYQQGRFGRSGSAGGAGVGVQYQNDPLGRRSVSAGGAAAGGSY